MRDNIQKSLINLKSDIDAIIENDEYIDRLEKLATIFKTGVDNNRRIFFTGVGKTSYAAHKLAATAKSIGIKAEYLDCQCAGHGDIGAIPESSACYCIYLSKSGKTTEHFELAKLIRKRRPNCTNIMLCFADDVVKQKIENDKAGFHEIINIPLNILESDSLGIVPTNSNALFEACISSALISAGMENKVRMFESLERNHPSGSLHDKVTKLLKEMSNS
jgi:D-arabinose 5-phosphate isomerase GutQ